MLDLKINFLSQEHPSSQATCNGMFIYQIEESRVINVKCEFSSQEIMPKFMDVVDHTEGLLFGG